ncbi:hypothetical protein AC579_3251 [Pseudocercospora musae]|uniref:F-box domain-containing protein n=1 Tax=Pseudocercospora musae TaxID=113226 RepID=A0A139HZW3_9PEZI|nr:hypothetical protein AC579_3251 [Pseudocercospora musae]
MTSSHSMHQLLDRLPKELYNRIYNETFSTSSQPTHIDRSWRPPSFSQVNRAARKTYYSSHKFVLSDQETYDAWSASHHGLLRDVRIRFEITEPRCQGMRGIEYVEMQHGIVASYLL